MYGFMLGEQERAKGEVFNGRVHSDAWLLAPLPPGDVTQGTAGREVNAKPGSSLPPSLPFPLCLLFSSVAF